MKVLQSMKGGGKGHRLIIVRHVTPVRIDYLHILPRPYSTSDYSTSFFLYVAAIIGHIKKYSD